MRQAKPFFLDHSFLPYDDGLTLVIALPDGIRSAIRLQHRAEEQAGTIENLGEHLIITKR